MPKAPPEITIARKSGPLKLREGVFIGVDPGKQGGIVAITVEDLFLGAESGYVLHGMPETEHDILQCIGLWAAYEGPKFATVEWIHPAIQGVGKSSMSKLYGNYMGVRMALCAASIPFETVMARKWQQAFNIATRGKTETQSQWKNRLKAKAQQLFPKLEGITLKTCDALLIAEYCRRKRMGELG